MHRGIRTQNLLFMKLLNYLPVTDREMWTSENIKGLRYGIISAYRLTGIVNTGAALASAEAAMLTDHRIRNVC
jgi:hypothetical protein